MAQELNGNACEKHELARTEEIEDLMDGKVNRMIWKSIS
jgi:hypothetical protein